MFYLHTFRRCIINSVILRYAHLRCIKFISRSRRKIVFNLIRSYIIAGYSNLDCKSFLENWRNSLSLRFREHALLSLYCYYLFANIEQCFVCSFRWDDDERKSIVLQTRQVLTHKHTHAHICNVNTLYMRTCTSWW